MNNLDEHLIIAVPQWTMLLLTTLFLMNIGEFWVGPIRFGFGRDFFLMKSYRWGDDFELRNICNRMLRNEIQKHLWSIHRSIFDSIGEYLIGIIN